MRGEKIDLGQFAESALRDILLLLSAELWELRYGVSYETSTVSLFKILE